MVTLRRKVLERLRWGALVGLRRGALVGLQRRIVSVQRGDDLMCGSVWGLQGRARLRIRAQGHYLGCRVRGQVLHS